MDKLPFVIWMIGWPLAGALERYLLHLRGELENYPGGLIVFVSLIQLIIWVVVAYALWKN